MPESELSLADQQSALTEEYLACRAEAETDAKAKRTLTRIEKKLDGLYWKIVEALVAGRVSPDRDELAFSEDERLVIDVGLIDETLVENASEDLHQTLLEEIQSPGPTNHFYLSEWLENRYRQYRLSEDVAASKASERESEEDKKLGQGRRKILRRLSGHFAGLPGVSPDVADFMTRGGLDERLIKLSLALLDHHDRRGFLYRSRLRDLRRQVLEKARSRVDGEEEVRLFDMLDELYVRDWRERAQANRQERKNGTAAAEVQEDVTRDQAVSYLVSELRFVKTLLPLGALAGGVTRTCAVLLHNGPRVTKADTAQGFELAQTCDRGYELNPLVMIAPYRGRGIFEWDRDSLVVGLVPVESAEDSVANAAGNYRMLIDSLQSDGALKTAYEARFPDENFQQAFQANYRTWIGQVGHGRREGMDEAHRAFFREFVGPETSGILAPPNLRNIGPQTRETIRGRLEKQIDTGGEDANLRRRLAVLYWQDGDLDAAFTSMAHAARLAPHDGEVLYSLGMLLEQQGKKEKAAGVYQACARRVPDSLWGVYARDASEALGEGNVSAGDAESVPGSDAAPTETS